MHFGSDNRSTDHQSDAVVNREPSSCKGGFREGLACKAKRLATFLANGNLDPVVDDVHVVAERTLSK